MKKHHPIFSKKGFKKTISFIGINPDLPKKIPVSEEDAPYDYMALIIAILILIGVPLIVVTIAEIFF